MSIFLSVFVDGIYGLLSLAILALVCLMLTWFLTQADETRTEPYPGYTTETTERKKRKPSDFLTDDDRKKLADNYVTFLDNLKSHQDVIDRLFASALLTKEQKECLIGKTTTDKVRYLLDETILRSSYEELSVIDKILRETNNKYLADLLPCLDATEELCTTENKERTADLESIMKRYQDAYKEVVNQLRELEKKLEVEEAFKREVTAINAAINNQLGNIRHELKSPSHEHIQSALDPFLSDLQERYELYQQALTQLTTRTIEQKIELDRVHSQVTDQRDLMMQCLNGLHLDIDLQLNNVNKRLASVLIPRGGESRRSAGFRAYIDLHHGPIADSILCFSKVEYNTGCYDAERSWFICKDAGMYVFTLTVTLQLGCMTCALLQNGQPRSRLVVKDGTASITLQLLCNTNDTVCVRVISTLQKTKSSFGTENDYLGTCFAAYKQME